MIFVFDENIPPKIVEALTALDAECCRIHTIHSVYDLKLNGYKDIDLFPKLRELFPDDKCVFISGDKMILRRPPEIATLKSNGLIAFICAPSACNKGMFDRAIYLINSWKSIVSLSDKSAIRTVYQIPARNFDITEKSFSRI